MVLIWAALVTGVASSAYGQTLEVATISKGGGVSSNGSVLIIGQSVAGTASNANFTLEIGIASLLTSESVCPASSAPQAEAIVVAKNRYLSFLPTNPGQQTALQVTLVSSTVPGADIGGQWWVGPASVVCENSGQDHGPPCGPTGGGAASVTLSTANLQCTQHCMDWGALGEVVQVGDRNIAPGSIYEIRAVDCTCDANNPVNFSLPLPVEMGTWGDLVKDCTTCPCGPPGAIASIDLIFDCVAVLKKFSNTLCPPMKARTDLAPEQPDRVIDILDVTRCVNAFKGASYPFSAPVGCP